MLAMFIEKMSEDFERPIKSPCKLYNSANAMENNFKLKFNLLYKQSSLVVALK